MRSRGRERCCQNQPKKQSKGSVTLFAPKTFKIHAAGATFHMSALAKTRMTSNQIKEPLPKLCFSSDELKIIFNCVKVSAQDLRDQTDAL